MSMTYITDSKFWVPLKLSWW